MSEMTAEALKRAIEEEREVRIEIEGVGEVEGEPLQQNVEPPRAKHFEGVRPPHGHMTVDVAVNPDELPSEEDTMPVSIIVGFHENARGEWKVGKATWPTRDEVSADAEETRNVESFELLSDE